MIPYPVQSERLNFNLWSAIVALRALIEDDERMVELIALARERHADGCAVYGDALYRKPRAEIECDVSEEIADALVYLAELAARARSESEDDSGP